MMKFFRKIRQQLLSENKPAIAADRFNSPERGSRLGKYLIYAVGEILLVVIGIIIALQLNNWNESRKAFNTEIELYGKLIDDLNSEYSNTDYNSNWMKLSQDDHYQVYNESKGKVQFNSTKSYNSLQWIFPFHLSIAEKHNESLTILSNDDIRDLLKWYIRQEQNTKDAYDEWNELKEQRLRPFFNKYGIHNTEDIFNDSRYNFYELTSVNLINHSKLQEQYGTIEMDELLFDLRFKTSWVFTKLRELKQANNTLEQALVNELMRTDKIQGIKRIPRKQISELLDDGKSIDEIIEIIKKEDKDQPVYDISERNLNILGYRLMSEEKNLVALKIFKLNTELYPMASNTYDSYGECLLKLGDKENAIKAYKKALELSPEDNNIIKILEELE